MENTALFSRFEDVHAQYTRLRAGVDALQRDLEGLEVTVRSPDGAVTVVVGPRGNLKAISLQDDEPLAMLILEAMRQAEQLATDAVRERLTEVVPESAGGIDGVLRGHDEAIGLSDTGR